MPSNRASCDLPNPSSPPGAVAVCGYTTDTNPCGAVNCYCMQGAWGCNPTCIFDGGGPETSGGDDGGSRAPDASEASVEAGLSEAGPFTCGTSTCPGGDYCEDHPPGVRTPDGSVPPDGYLCDPIPSSCAATPTCACIQATLSPGDPCSKTAGVTCTDDGAGHVIIHCIGV